MPDRVPAINVSELTKRYGPPDSGLLAVDHASFQVYQGEVFGFLMIFLGGGSSRWRRCPWACALWPASCR